MVITRGTSAAYYKCGDYKKRRTCSNSLGVKEEIARARIFSALQEKFNTPDALDYLRKRIAEFLGESNRDASRELVERRASLARTEQRIAALIRFVADGDSSEYVVTALRDLHAQARTEKAAVAALEARGAAPIALPTPAEVASRALGLKRLFEGNPIEVLAEGYYVAEGRFLPLVALTDPILETTKPPIRGLRLENFSSCAGAIPSVDNGHCGASASRAEAACGHSGWRGQRQEAAQWAWRSLPELHGDSRAVVCPSGYVRLRLA